MKNKKTKRNKEMESLGMLLDRYNIEDIKEYKIYNKNSKNRRKQELIKILENNIFMGDSDKIEYIPLPDLIIIRELIKKEKKEYLSLATYNEQCLYLVLYYHIYNFLNSIIKELRRIKNKHKK